MIWTRSDRIAPISASPRVLETFTVGLAVFLLLSFAAAEIAPGWDEGYVWERLDVLRPWLRQVLDPAADHARLFSQAVLNESWRFSKEEPDGHGPFYALLSLAGFNATSWLLPPPLSYRMGSVALFAFAAGCVYATLAPRWGRWIAAPTIILIASPRVVPELCFGLVDGPLLSLSLLTWCGFNAAIARPTFPRILCFGLPCGLAMATKLTGWFFFAPYLVWLLLWRDKGAAKVLLIGGAAALVTVFALNVGWFPDPIDGLHRFFLSNLTRAATRPIPIWFLGRQYDFALPWYNTLVWTAVAAPVGTVILGSLGIAFAARRIRRDGFGLLLALNWGMIVVLRALPQAPGHDGTRQIDISFAFLALLAGYGADALVRCGWLAIARAAILAAAAASASNCVAYHPFQLSYYSVLVGGLRGAAERFEPTYFWDAFTPDMRRWLDENTSKDRSILFANYTPTFRYLYKWNLLRSKVFAPDEKAPPQWYIVQNRTGMLKPEDSFLLGHMVPAHRKAFKGVTLLCVFSIEQLKEAVEATRKQASKTFQKVADGFQ